MEFKEFNSVLIHMVIFLRGFFLIRLSPVSEVPLLQVVMFTDISSGHAVIGNKSTSD